MLVDPAARLRYDQEVEDALVRQQGAERDTWHKILKNEQREQANKKLAAEIVAKVCKKHVLLEVVQESVVPSKEKIS